MLTLKRSVEAISRQIKAEGGPKLARAHAKVDSLVAQLLILNKTKSTKEVSESNAKKQVNTMYHCFLNGGYFLSALTIC